MFPLTFFEGWQVLLTIIISLLALLATFYQLYLQRIHNEKSLKPLGQIDLRDRGGQIYVCIANNGMGPLIVHKLTFIKDSAQYSNIEDCLSFDPKRYKHIFINESVKKVILPNSSLDVFAAEFEEHEGAAERDSVKQQLSPIILKVDCKDIYDNKISFERNLEWFSRHVTKENGRDAQNG